MPCYVLVVSGTRIVAGYVLNKYGYNSTQIKGDSGGPLTVDVDGHHFLIGATSFGEGCGDVS